MMEYAKDFRLLYVYRGADDFDGGPCHHQQVPETTTTGKYRFQHFEKLSPERQTLTE